MLGSEKTARKDCRLLGPRASGENSFRNIP